jgi:hypothetical protein
LTLLNLKKLIIDAPKISVLCLLGAPESQKQNTRSKKLDHVDGKAIWLNNLTSQIYGERQTDK